MSGKRLKPSRITNFFEMKARLASEEDQKPDNPNLPISPPLSLHNKHDQAANEWCFRRGIPENAADGTVADFIVRDPAHRPPNLFFLKQLMANPRLLRDVIQTYVRMGTYQPRVSEYPARVIGGSARSFRVSWFDQHQWLEYSPTTDAIYCLYCYLSRDVMTMQHELSVYAQPCRGYSNWKKALTKDGFSKHIGQNCSKHHSAALEFGTRQTTQQDVSIALQQQSRSQRLQNRARVTLILDICLLLAKQEISFRGNDEKVSISQLSPKSTETVKALEVTMDHLKYEKGQ